MSGLLTAAELAKLLHVSPQWVTDRANDDDLPGYRLGRSWRFDAAEVTAWLSRRGNAPTRLMETTRRVLPDPKREPSAPQVNLETALDAAEVAAALDVPLATVKNWVRVGVLPGLIVSGRCLVDLDGFQQWQRTIGGPTGRIGSLPRGQSRTSSIRDAIDSAILRRRAGNWGLSPRSARLRGVRIPTWAEVFPSGRL